MPKHPTVIAGLDPAIHAGAILDRRVEPGDDNKTRP
jgi:hypothetical protein